MGFAHASMTTSSTAAFLAGRSRIGQQSIALLAAGPRISSLSWGQTGSSLRSWVSARGYADEAKEVAARPSMSMIGVAHNEYIPPTGENKPGLKHPKLFFRDKFRGALWFGKMVIRLGLLRIKYKHKPHLKEWKQDATSTYIAINKAFANRELGKIDNMSSIYVHAQLKERVKNMDANWKLTWDLVDFVEPTRLIDVAPLDLQNGQPVEMVQLTYRFHTIQKLEMRYKKNANVPPKTEQKKVLDYMVFTLNIVTGEMTVSGTVFESSLLKPLPTIRTDQAVLAASMKEKGDIFRKKPAPVKYD
ncbi:MBA1-like protein-domain-containing protein [Myxozyma melibiosi]|uniref:MBA1-like protein-domain-containing protein n=1 Tax=Myxozyma melibiosi TaxID=54550 RepID=A0ABR1F5F1_9ASCO